MSGNCRHAQPGFGKNEMYPCVDEWVTYGLAVTGLAVNGTAGSTSLTVDLKYEPNVRSGDEPALVHSSVVTTGLTPGKKYLIHRYVGTETLPHGPPFTSPNATVAVTADAQGTAAWANPPLFESNSAVYHFAEAA